MPRFKVNIWTLPLAIAAVLFLAYLFDLLSAFIFVNASTAEKLGSQATGPVEKTFEFWTNAFTNLYLDLTSGARIALILVFAGIAVAVLIWAVSTLREQLTE